MCYLLVGVLLTDYLVTDEQVINSASSLQPAAARTDSQSSFRRGGVELNVELALALPFDFSFGFGFGFRRGLA